MDRQSSPPVNETAQASLITNEQSEKTNAATPPTAPPNEETDKSAPAAHDTDPEDEKPLSGSDDITDTQEEWKGWAELENDPLIFTKLLKDWGVSSIKVDEVIPLDSILEKPPWTAPERNETAVEATDHLWFANQISTFSCATLALMNIINNVQQIDLGPQIEEFKESTALMSPKERGQALDNFAFVRDIHNSFSRDLDHLIVDLKLKEDSQAAARRRAPNKKKKKRRKRTKDLMYDEEDSGFHFVAYVASRGDVWKLDGMEASPRLLGSYTGDENWLMSTISDIQMQLDGPEANAMEFSLLSLTRQEGMTIDPEDEIRVERMKEDWSLFFAHMLKLHAERGDVENMVAW